MDALRPGARSGRFDLSRETDPAVGLAPVAPGPNYRAVTVA